jgi:propanol-preferring alcohol dehydrogenase
VDSCELKPGQWLGVIGAGGLGQIATQYAKAMGLNVVAIDINEKTLEVCQAQGADAIFNLRTDQEYVTKIKDLTGIGVHAAAVFSNAKVAYTSAPRIIRPGGVLMVIGLPYEPLEISAMDLALAKYRIKSEGPGIPQRLKKAVDFSAQHNIAPEVELRKLEELDDMVNEMRAGTATKRMAVTFI